MYRLPQQQPEDLRKDLFNRLYDSVTNGSYFYYDKPYFDAQQNYNIIMNRLQKVISPDFVESLLNSISLRADDEQKIYNSFNSKAAVVIHRMKQIHKERNVVEGIIRVTQQEYQRTFTSGYWHKIQLDNVYDQLTKIINKVKIYEEGMRLIAEYPHQVNIQKMQQFIKEKSTYFDFKQQDLFIKIQQMKKEISIIDQKFKDYRTKMLNFGTMKQLVQYRLSNPCSDIVQCYRYAEQFLRIRLLNKNEQKNKSYNYDYKFEMLKMIQQVAIQQVAGKDYIQKIHKKMSNILTSVGFPFEDNNLVSSSDSQNLKNLFIKLQSIKQLVSYYSQFANRIDGMKQILSQGQLISQDNYSNNYYNLYLNGKKKKWRKSLQNCLKYLSRSFGVDTKTQLPQYCWQKEITQLTYKASNVSNRQVYEKKTYSNEDIDNIIKENKIFQVRWDTIHEYLNWHDDDLEKQLSKALKQTKDDSQLDKACADIVCLKKIRKLYRQEMQKVRIKINLNKSFEKQNEITEKRENIQQQIQKYKNDIQQLTNSNVSYYQFQNYLLQQLKKAAVFLNLPYNIYPQNKQTIVKLLVDIINKPLATIDNLQKNINLLLNNHNIVIKQRSDTQVLLKQANETAMRQIKSLKQQKQRISNERGQIIFDEGVKYLEKIAKINAQKETQITLRQELIKANSQLLTKISQLQIQKNQILNQLIKSEQDQKQTSLILNIQNLFIKINDQYNSKIQLLFSKLKSTQSKIYSLQKQVIKLKSEKLQRQTQFQELKISSQTKQKEMSEINKNLRQKTQKLKDETKAQRKQIQDLKLSLEILKQDHKNLLDLMQMKGYQMQPQENSKVTTDTAQLQKTVNQLKIQINNLNQKLQLKENDIRLLNKNLSQEKNLSKKLEQQYKFAKDETMKHKSMIEDTKSNNKLTRPPNKGAINENQIKEAVRKQLLQTIQRQFQAHKKKLRQLYLQKYVAKQNQMNEKELNGVYLAYLDKLFQGELLQSQITMKHRLITHLQKFTNRFITKTRMVYKLDLKNKTNFHQYIDKTSNLLCLIKTSSGVYLAGYYTGTYLSESMTQPGLLISITNNDSYQLNVPDNQTKTNYRAMVYDLYFLIFGNAQLRIKTGEKVLFSNFGIMNSYFNPKGKKLIDFIGPENKRDVNIQSYEIYEVIYENVNYQS